MRSFDVMKKDLLPIPGKEIFFACMERRAAQLLTNKLKMVDIWMSTRYIVNRKV